MKNNKFKVGINMDIKDFIGGGSVLMGIIISGIGWFLGGYDGILLCVVLFMVIDVITGYMQAMYNSNFSSYKGWKGLIKKVAYLLVVGIVSIIDTQILHVHGALRYAILLWMIGNDGFSIIENLLRMDIKLPVKLTQIFEIMQKRIDDIEIPETEMVQISDKNQEGTNNE